MKEPKKSILSPKNVGLHLFYEGYFIGKSWHLNLLTIRHSESKKVLFLMKSQCNK